MEEVARWVNVHCENKDLSSNLQTCVNWDTVENLCNHITAVVRGERRPESLWKLEGQLNWSMPSKGDPISRWKVRSGTWGCPLSSTCMHSSCAYTEEAHTHSHTHPHSHILPHNILSHIHTQMHIHTLIHIPSHTHSFSHTHPFSSHTYTHIHTQTHIRALTQLFFSHTHSHTYTFHIHTLIHTHNYSKKETPSMCAISTFLE